MCKILRVLQGENFRTIDSPTGLLGKRLKMAETPSFMTNEFTTLVAEELAQKSGLDERELELVDKKVAMLGEQVRACVCVRVKLCVCVCVCETVCVCVCV